MNLNRNATLNVDFQAIFGSITTIGEIRVAMGLARIERFCEPTVDDETVARHPRTYDHRIIAYFLQLRVRKPA